MGFSSSVASLSTEYGQHKNRESKQRGSQTHSESETGDAEMEIGNGCCA